jgi:RimJ/RimL family protein N-acetyltransferase
MKRVLHTRRLRLRAPQPGDEQAAFTGWAQDPQVLRFMGWPPHTELADTRRQLDWEQARWLKRSAFTWLLVEPQGGPIGMVQLTPQRLDGPPHHLRLGYLMARSHQRQGLMAEAASAVLAHAFEEPSVWRVDALCDVDNLASQALLAKLGLQREGRLARHSLHPNLGEQPRDVWVYAAWRGEPPSAVP